MDQGRKVAGVPLQRISALVRAHPYGQDTALACGILLLTIYGPDPGTPRGLGSGLPDPQLPAAAIWATGALQCLTLIWRRRAPLAVFVTVFGACVVQWALLAFPRSDLCLMISLYSLARYASPRLWPWAGGITLVAMTLAVLRIPQFREQGAVGLFFLCTAVTASIALGQVARGRQAKITALVERAAHLEREREQSTRLAVLSERARVLREMHDILGHNLAVIIGLADGGGSRVTGDPELGRQALDTIAETGRQALSELRHLLGALGARTPGRAADLTPQPGLADLGPLLERTRAVGPLIAYREQGDPAGLSPVLQLAVYRIVQESVTNTLKYAGPRTTLHVTLTITDREADITVTDTGPPGHSAAAPAAEGRGLPGIRERAALVGGHATAGPDLAGGWSVRAVLPLTCEEGLR